MKHLYVYEMLQVFFSMRLVWRKTNEMAQLREEWVHEPPSQVENSSCFVWLDEIVLIVMEKKQAVCEAEWFTVARFGLTCSK